MHKKFYLFFLFLILATPLLPARGSAQPPERTEATYRADFDLVWDNVVETLIEMGLSEHPHGKMSVNRKSGKITTPVFRYFKIASAKPVQEKDYQDSYTITVETKRKWNKGNTKKVKVKIQRKFEIYDNVKKGWTEADPTAEKVGFTEEALLDALDSKMATTASAGADRDAIPPNLIQTPPLFTNEESKPG
jgi:hypothetical protein